AQEPGSNEEIAQFCQRNYDVSFELFDKVHAIGENKHPLYARLSEQVAPTGEVKWNFEKFLVDKEGNAVARFASGVKPDDPAITGKIEE
ncbi:glutathione peroxidase, partial [Microbacteriaceae bacterium K1510]|nr:glutathione peroxidase [Microbacteriaceae bacterium K1510]